MAANFEGGVTLGELIEALEKVGDKRLPFGIGFPSSYRGYYECLAFSLCSDWPAADSLRDAREAVGHTFTGWKGGEFLMTKDTECYVADSGATGWPITPELLAFMLESAR